MEGGRIPITFQNIALINRLKILIEGFQSSGLPNPSEHLLEAAAQDNFIILKTQKKTPKKAPHTFSPSIHLLNKFVISTANSGKELSDPFLGDPGVTLQVSGVKPIPSQEGSVHNLIVRAVIINQPGTGLQGFPMAQGLNCAAHASSHQL